MRSGTACAILEGSGERFKGRKLKKSHRRRSRISFREVGSALGGGVERVGHVVSFIESKVMGLASCDDVSDVGRAGCKTLARRRRGGRSKLRE